MRLTILLLIISLMQVNAETLAQRISLHKRKASLESVLKEIRKQSGYDFFYDGKIIPKNYKVDVALSGSTVEEALEVTLKGLPVEYRIENQTVVLRTRKAAPEIKTEDLLRITGIVTDSIGVRIQGVSVANKTNGSATSTDAEGAFIIEAKEGDVLVFSSVGYIRQEVRIANQTPLRVILKQMESQLDQVVVTALGIKKSTKSLTYNVQELKGEELTRNKDANFVNALTGKIAGVTINPSSSGIGGATRVVMRGTKSISGNNNVLYVVDGIPIPNSNGGAGATGAFSAVVSGEGISSFNPEDIETITALTGPSATALYGNQGANGVLLVTTKKGMVGKLNINFSHSSDFFNPFVLPEFQNTYGQENTLEMASWGSKLATPSTYRPKDFFQTGRNIFNTVSISGGTEKSQTLVSAGTNNAEGIISNNTFNRYNFYLRHTANLTERLTLDFNAMYVRLENKNMIAQGQYHNPLLPIYLFPPGDDIRKYQVYERYDMDRQIPLQFWPYKNQGLGMENPYWTINAETNTNKTDRYMLSAVAKYKFTDWLDLTGRARMDNSNSIAESKYPAGTDPLYISALNFGLYTVNNGVSKNIYLDLIASVKHKITETVNFNTNIGGSYVDNRFQGLSVGGPLVRLANFYSIGENTANIPNQFYDRSQLQSAFMTAEFDYNKWLYLNATGRYEWPSQLPKKFAAKSSYFYPSVGISAVLTDVLQIPENILSFAKLRFSYAEVGAPPSAGVANPSYSLTNPDAFRPRPFTNYIPERTRSLEAGAELKFFHNKLRLNVTAYKSNTFNQLLSVSNPEGSLYTTDYFNAGDIQNKGIEASLGYQFDFKEFNWNTNAVFTLNRNEVKRLAEGYVNPVTGEVFGRDSLRFGTVGNDLINILTVGGGMSDLYVTQLLREDNQGNLWIDNGMINKMKIPARYIGRTVPDYTIGWSNNLSYRNFALSFLIDARIGGMGISYTQAVMDAYGVSQQSAIDRDNGGVSIYGNKFSDVKQFYNTIGGASGGEVGMAAYYVFSASNVRLREASLGYTIPGKWLGTKIRNIQLAFTGRNLFMFYNKSPFDPESTSSTGTYYQGIDYFRQPSYRSYGFSVKAQF
ncbi:SusC/RagA family TonB-linked outer membrane protein [Sphingobacterium spiritivorum]|nr:SusC/RagA family TonB-linked outer membrane protein [Sphingobacterium spiritivorum]